MGPAVVRRIALPDAVEGRRIVVVALQLSLLQIDPHDKIPKIQVVKGEGHQKVGGAELRSGVVAGEGSKLPLIGLQKLLLNLSWVRKTSW